MYPPYFLTVGDTGNAAISMIVQQTNRALIDIYRRLPEGSTSEGSKIIKDAIFNDSTDCYLFDNLDINTDKGYEFEFSLVNNLSQYCEYKIYINNEKNDTNYYTTRMWSDGTTYGDELQNFPKIAYLSTKGNKFITGKIFLIDFYCIITAYSYRNDNYLILTGIRSTNTFPNINSILISATSDEGIGVNSRFILRKI